MYCTVIYALTDIQLLFTGLELDSVCKIELFSGPTLGGTRDQ